MIIVLKFFHLMKMSIITMFPFFPLAIYWTFFPSGAACLAALSSQLTALAQWKAARGRKVIEAGPQNGGPDRPAGGLGRWVAPGPAAGVGISRAATGRDAPGGRLRPLRRPLAPGTLARRGRRPEVPQQAIERLLIGIV